MGDALGVPAESRGPVARVGPGEVLGLRAALGKDPQGLRGRGAEAPSSLRCPVGLEVGSVSAQHTGVI